MTSLLDKKNPSVLGMQAKSIVQLEAHSLQMMAERIDTSFDRAIEVILAMRGRVVVVGMGKSGIIGRKIAATLASTGTPALFVHPGEAFHGDLGMIKDSDIALLLSYSGETEEVIRILPYLQSQANKIIAITGNKDSTLAQIADVVLDISIEKEACNNNLAPTTSTTCALVMGDALAVVLSAERNFQPEDFAKFHPGGSLGKKLLTRVADVMHTERLPICSPDSNFRDVVHVVNQGRLGLALVMEDEKLVGIITDGDIRRAFDRGNDCKIITASNIMTRSPLTIAPSIRFSEAEIQMRAAKVSALVVKNEDNRVVGILQIYDL